MKAALLVVLLVCGSTNGADESAISLKDVPRWGADGIGYKVGAFVTAAGKFQVVGKEKACALLSKLADPKEVVTEDEHERQQGLIILCRMLFVAKRNAEFRRPALGAPSCVGDRRFKDWALEPIEIIDEVPFLIVKGYALGGLPEPVQDYVNYCIERGEWNTHRYLPKSDEEQRKALEKLLASPKLKGITPSDRKFLTSQIDRPDILLADFEGDAFPAGWKTTGTAFGMGPAKGTLLNQMPVSGFLGQGLVNSYLGGDGSTGTLTSAPFKIERKYLNFLVGGGKHAKTRVDLLVGGKAVRAATGPNDKSGGSERLDWHTWDVGEFEGKEAVIEIVDGETGGWGHINADHFVQSDKKKQAEPKVREFTTIDKRYLHLPVKNGALVRRVAILVRPDNLPEGIVFGEEIVREFDIEFADGVEPDFWVFADLSPFKGKRLLVKSTLPADSTALDTLKLADEVPDAEKLYREKHRPLFHFTSRRGWLNDPNGLVYHDGEWHLFYQHNPFGREWGNMHWGHAVSKDLVRWKEEGIALYPKKYGDWAFSGSAVLDKDNTSGWGANESAPGVVVPVFPEIKPPLVLAYTSTGRGECMAFSNDKGRTWTEYDKNPVVKHAGRDPKLVWYEKGKHWVMAVYDEHDKKQWIAFYTSPDLKEWKFASRIEGFYECPDLFELPVGEDGKHGSKWILYAADGKYVVGEFDGKQFKPDHKEKKQLWYGNFYAAQTFDNAPFGYPYIGPDSPVRTRRIQIGWARGVTFPGSPFNQQMTVPAELGLGDQGKGDIRLGARPVDELRNYRDPKGPLMWKHDSFDKPRTIADNLDAFDVEYTIDLGKATGFTFDLRGTRLVCDFAKRTLVCKDVRAPLPDPGKQGYRLRILVDRGSIEVFAGGTGTVAMSIAAIPDEKNRKVELIPHGGEIRIHGNVYPMKSAWEK